MKHRTYGSSCCCICMISWQMHPNPKFSIRTSASKWFSFEKNILIVICIFSGVLQTIQEILSQYLFETWKILTFVAAIANVCWINIFYPIYNYTHLMWICVYLVKIALLFPHMWIIQPVIANTFCQQAYI